MTSDKKAALREAVTDTVIATILNFPLNLLLVAIAFNYELTIFQTSVFFTVVFSGVAIARKTYIRLYFNKRAKRKAHKSQ
jgi:ABC-type bacteriocin/lantibiotic exporter with double-glycine peptidase domain